MFAYRGLKAGNVIVARIMAPVMVLVVSAVGAAQMRITEYAYSGNGAAAEFIEFTNIGGTAIDLTGWSYDDDSRVPGTVNLSAFGTVAPGQSVVLSEAGASTFATAWGLSGITIIGDNIVNLGRNDEINLYDDNDALVDRLTYGDQAFPGTIRTNGFSGWTCNENLGANLIGGWVLSVIGDDQNSMLSSEGNVGSPGTWISIACGVTPTGACCEAGVCNVRTQVECTPLGLYQGDDTLCEGEGSVTCPTPTNAIVRITEYMHGGNGGEFIEFTNLDDDPVDMTGWSYSDITRLRGQVDLSAFGTLAPGASVILTESVAGDFIVDWSLSGVPVIGGNSVNIGQDDEINLYDPSGAQVDRLTYGTTGFPNSVDADGAGAWPCADAVGINEIMDWRRSTVGDVQGSVLSLVGDVGSPGSYTSVACGPGSCCVNGSCSVETRGDCNQLGGLFLGDDTDCTNNPCPAPSNTLVRLTEYMYSGIGAEFMEITNLGGTPVSLTGWSFSDTGIPGEFDLSPMGTLGAGESGLVTDIDPSLFRSDWGLSESVKVVRIPTSELGRNDFIRIFDNSGSLVDQLAYGDEAFPGTIRTQNFSGWPLAPAVGNNNIFQWVLSEVGDVQSSVMSGSGDVGNPGNFVLHGGSNDVPTVSGWGLMVLSLLIVTIGSIIVTRRTELA